MPIHEEEDGIMTVVENGWQVECAGEVFPMTPLAAHNLLTLETGNHYSEEPGSFLFTLAAGTVFLTRDGESFTIGEPLCLYIARAHLAALVWSVACARYGQQAFVYHGEVTQRCFGDKAHIPQNALEASFWWHNYWLGKKAPESWEQYFRPGQLLCGFTEQSLGSLEQYRVLYEKARQQKGESHGSR